VAEKERRTASRLLMDVRVVLGIVFDRMEPIDLTYRSGEEAVDGNVREGRDRDHGADRTQDSYARVKRFGISDHYLPEGTKSSG
jgi:hypothetical protein